jgi:hypothetical protein
VRSFALFLLIPLLGFSPREGIDRSGPSSPESWTLERAGPGAEPSPPGALPAKEAPHDLHVSYGNLGVEGAVAILQLRIFKNDLEEALRRLDGRDSFLMAVSPEVDALFLRYLAQRFNLEVGGEVLDGQIVGSGDDELDREPVWWYQVQYTASGPIRAARITNTILFEIFHDQSNVLRVVRFPEETRRAYYFAHGEETIEIEF